MLVGPVFTQSERLANYGEQFIQRLTWDTDPNVFKYEVIIEHESGGIAKRQITTSGSIEVSLPPGRYRYTVAVYNLLDMLEYRMDPVAFEVLEALRPVVTGWTPQIFILANGNNEVILSGTNFQEGSYINFINSGTGGAQAAVPAKIQILDNGASARVTLPINDMNTGTWTMYITNPGGLSTAVSGFKIQNRNRLNLDLSVLFSPLMPVRSENDFFSVLSFIPADNFLFETVLVNDFYLGAGLRLAWLPIRTSHINFGLLFEPYAANMVTDLGYATTNPFLVSAHLSLVMQTLLLNKHLALHISAGGGMLGMFNLFINSNDGTNTGYDFLSLPFVDIGLSLKIYPSESFFAEFGASWDITLPFMHSDIQFVKPEVGLGYSF